jgi:hypothetical protein
MVKPMNVLRDIKIKNRGLCERKGSAAGIKEFIEEWFEPAVKSGEYKTKDPRIMGTK